MTKLIFCNDFLNPKKVDSDFADEYRSAQQTGAETFLVSHEELTGNEEPRSIDQIPNQQNEELAIYRGWMITPLQYERLYKRLVSKNLRLINTPDEFAHTHYLPNCYPVIKEVTPKTVNLPVSGDIEFHKVHSLLREFGTAPILIKDYVKSEKHYWKEACYIPNASDKDVVETVTRRFLELRGDNLNEGVVFREFVELEFLKDHSLSGMPLTKEFRTFWINGKLMAMFNYWDEGNYSGINPPMSLFEKVAKRIRSTFFSMDIAQKTDGSWVIIELGDGQVSGLPDNARKADFYSNLVTSF